MNKLFKYISLTAFVFLNFACSDVLELEPRQSIQANQALSSDQNVKAVLIGAYDELGVGNFWGGEVLRNSELLGSDGEVFWQGTFFDPREIFNKQINTDNGDVEGVWLDAYETINIANSVLSAIDVVIESDRNSVQGQALFIRAACYFELVRFFAQQYMAGGGNTQAGVPLVLEPTTFITEDSFVSRADVETVYTQIVNDLTQAVSLLGNSIGFRVNTHGASALLARVYLQMGNYSAALDAANSVISSGEYELLDNYADVFNRGIDPGTGGQQANTDEDIFAMQVSAQDGTNSMTTFFSVSAFGGRDGDIRVTDAHLNLYDPTDERLALFFQDGGDTFSGKWNNQNGNIGIIRLAEMYLIRAECNQRLGTTTGATPLDDYNAIHTRAGLAAAATVDLDAILLERRLELAQEGFKIHDARRLGLTVDSGQDPNGNTYIYPIPFREIEANPSLTQNPGY